MAPGQPFRLALWRRLCGMFQDPDAGFLDLLPHGVPLGVDDPSAPVPPSSVMLPSEPDPPRPLPLEHCSSAWQSALSDPTTVDALLAEEVREGWIRELPGGLPALQARYRYSAIGKLGLVKYADRPPRLVVDSSVSRVTENTSLPNRSAYPGLKDLRRCMPTAPAQEQLTALVLDVSKAHRRILIRPEDQGLLCFHHRDWLYQCLTLNFGARASGLFWSRLAGLLLRLSHRVVYLRHALLIYVDDLLALLPLSAASVWASVL